MILFLGGMSATTTKNSKFAYYEIDEFDVIDAGLITKALYVNEGIQQGQKISNDYDILLDLADAKRKQIAQQWFEPKTATFRIPEQDFFKFDPGVKREIEFLSNAYRDYTSGFNTTMVRSMPAQLFEYYCEKHQDVDRVYKNGDTGQQYFSIVYVDGVQKKWLFYPDYIVMKKDGSILVIETKGGEISGHSKNIDVQIENKFNAFKQYAKRTGINVVGNSVLNKVLFYHINSTIVQL